jgi:hypothetical protein
MNRRAFVVAGVLLALAEMRIVRAKPKPVNGSSKTWKKVRRTR